MVGRQLRCMLVPHAVAMISRRCSVGRTEGMAHCAAGRRLWLQKAGSDCSACAMLDALHTWLSQASRRLTACALLLLALHNTSAQGPPVCLFCKPMCTCHIHVRMHTLSLPYGGARCANTA